jgi:hypothetical protein
VKYARKAGGRWRFLASRLNARGGFFPGHMYGEQIAIDAADYGPNEFDELVVGSWLHVEQMDTGHWWMSIGGVTLFVDADRDGRPKRVTVFGPGSYDEAREGCEYDVTW